MNFFVKVIKLGDNIAKSKNRALKEALKSSHDHFFLVEDIVKVNDENIYQKFIDTAEKTGINCLMWANCIPNQRIDFNDDKNIEYWADFGPCFTYYSRKAIEKAGLFDENMPHNTLQEMYLAKTIGDLGLSTPFGMFASPKNVFGLEMTDDRGKWLNKAMIDKALDYWESKDGEDFPIDVKNKTETVFAKCVSCNVM